MSMRAKFLNNRTLIDLFIYLVVPLVIWNTCRSFLGDYLAMLLSTVPGIIYTLYTFFKEKQYSVTGLLILTTMVISGMMDVFSRSAHQMLWNMVYMNSGLVLLWCFTMVIKKPMAMYFFIDYSYLNGVPKSESRSLYMQKPFFRYFIYLTLFMTFRELSDIFLRIFLIHLYDVEGFNKIKVITQIWNMLTTIMFVYGIILIIKQIHKHQSTSLQ
jgi:hypothetical protein